MVRFLFFLLLFPACIWSNSVEVRADVSRSHVYEHYPIAGTVIVTHPKDQEIDVDSFTYEGKPLRVEIDKEMRVDPKSPLMISIFYFTLPEQPAGLQTLEPISVKIAGKEYRSRPVLYRVFKAEAPTSLEEPYLELQTIVEADEPLYPGQRLKFIYRYIYRGNIQMTRENLPLLSPQGFKQIGEERVEDFNKGDKSVREITLEVEAQAPGEFSFSSSLIEGMANVAGKGAVKLRSETGPVRITVAPFPEGQRSSAFGGVTGAFTIKSALAGPEKVSVGDRLTLVVDIFGKPNALENVELPDLYCQPGFPGMFVSGDLPIIGKIEGDRKRFTLYLRPTNDAVTEIPSIELLSYNPQTKKYEKSLTEPIPIEVEPVSNVQVETRKALIPPQKAGRAEDWTRLLRDVGPVEVTSGVYLTSYDLQNLPFAGWYVLLILPAGIFLIGAQLYWKRILDQSSRETRMPTSEELMDEAYHYRHDPNRFFDLFNRALKMHLVENGELESLSTPSANLPEGAVRDLILEIENRRYGQGEPVDPNDALKKAFEVL